jgi:hypothetical protein
VIRLISSIFFLLRVARTISIKEALPYHKRRGIATGRK